MLLYIFGLKYNLKIALLILLIFIIDLILPDAEVIKLFNIGYLSDIIIWRFIKKNNKVKFRYFDMNFLNSFV